MRIDRVSLALVLILAFGFVLRLASTQWNWFMHGDVIADASVSASLQRDGSFRVFPSSAADPAAYVLPGPGSGEVLKLHGPLWPLLGLGVTRLRGGAPGVESAFVSFRILSLVAGMLVVYLSYLVATRVTYRAAGLAAAAWVAASYVLIDYAGNGALYTGQACIYLLWILVAFRPPSVFRSLVLGLLTGVAYLLTFQAVILLPAAILLFAADTRPWRRILPHAAIVVAAAAGIASPWLVRNALVLGNAFYPHTYNVGYVYGKAGYDIPVEQLGQTTLHQKLGVLHSIVTLWIPNNTYYVARKLFVIAPMAFFLFAFGLIDVAFSALSANNRLRRLWPLLLILTFHGLLCAAWPVWKFRFFVTLLPLVFILAAEQLWSLPVSRRLRHACAAVTFLALVIVGILTYRAVPTHTTYYDGALTQDPFHGWEEKDHLRRFHLLPPGP